MFEPKLLDLYQDLNNDLGLGRYALPPKKSLIPFPSVMMMNQAGGTPPADPSGKINFVGVTLTANTTQTHAANKMSLIKITAPAYTATVRCLLLRQYATTAAGVHLKPVVYTDSGGNPGTLVAQGNEFTTSAAADANLNMDIALTFPTPFALTANADYWIGFINDAGFNTSKTGNVIQFRSYANTYASGAPTTPGAGTGTNDEFTCYLEVSNPANPASGTGFISQVSWTPTLDPSRNRQALPADITDNDILIAHVTYINTGGAPLFFAHPSWTFIDEQQIGAAVNYRELLYWKRVNGQEGWLDFIETVATPSALMVTISLWRGYTTGTFFENEATTGGTGTTATGTGISTTGNNRTVVNFYSHALDEAAGGAGGSGWADVYNLHTNVGNDGGSFASFKDIPTAQAVTAEVSRTFSISNWWRSMTLALIKA